jgi:hypothetical protein
MAFLMIWTEDIASISINKVQPVSCSQPLKQSKPRDETMP